MRIKLRQLPNELWMQALGHLNRHDVVDKLDFLWDRHFMPILCAWLLEYKRWQLARLQFCPPPIWQPNMFSDWPARMSADARLRRSWDGKGWKFVPIATQEEPMPEKVDGFELIDISYMDPTVLLFLSKVQPLFEHVNLKFCFVEDERDEVGAFIGNLMPMVKSVDTMAVCLPAFFQLHGYHSATLFGVKVLEFLAQDLSDEVTEMLVCWLFTPREDGEPRMLMLSHLANAPGWAYNKFVRKLRRFFLRELTPCNFFIRLPTGVYENRWVNNERTGEDLRVEKYGVIIRCAETREGGRVDERVVPVLNWRWHNQGRRIALSSTRGNVIAVEDESDDADDVEMEEPCCSNKLSHLGPERLE